MKKGDFDMKKGFTFIEVSLVLAIAGLIFIMVFIALPAVQRIQRDAEREENISWMLQALKKYQTNNRGALPEGTTGNDGVTYNSNSNVKKNSWEGFYKEYLGKDFTDPTGENYRLVVSACSDSSGQPCNTTKNAENWNFDTSKPKIYVQIHSSCDGSVAIGAENPRRVSATYKLEGAGAYCANT